MSSELVLSTTTSKPFAIVRRATMALVSALAVAAIGCGSVGGGGGDVTPDAGSDDRTDGGCPAGYAGPSCTDCDTGYQDIDGDGECKPSCEATGELAFDCSGHGTCELDEQGDRVCACDEGYRGATCDACAPGYVMGASGCELYTPSATNLVLWLDAQEGTVSMVGSSAVANWRDRRGGTSTLQAIASGTAQPTRVQNGLNGRTVLRFDGNDNMAIASFPGMKAADYTVIAVFKPTGTSAGTVLSLAHSEFGAMYSLRRTSSTTYRYSHRGSPAAVDGDFAEATFAAAQATTPKLMVTQRYTSGTFKFVLISGNTPGDLDGVTEADGVLTEGNLSGTLSLQIGAGSLTGDIAEILIYDRAVLQAELNEIRAYLAAKWGIE